MKLISFKGNKILQTQKEASGLRTPFYLFIESMEYIIPLIEVNYLGIATHFKGIILPQTIE
jgi:hypothetical protein